jgi:hypothetical protein
MTRLSHVSDRRAIKAPFMQAKSVASAELARSGGSLCHAPCEIYFGVGAWSMELIPLRKGELRSVAPTPAIGIRAKGGRSPELSARSIESQDGLVLFHVAVQRLASSSLGAIAQYDGDHR